MALGMTYISSLDAKRSYDVVNGYYNDYDDNDEGSDGSNVDNNTLIVSYSQFNQSSKVVWLVFRRVRACKV